MPDTGVENRQVDRTKVRDDLRHARGDGFFIGDVERVRPDILVERRNVGKLIGGAGGNGDNNAFASKTKGQFPTDAAARPRNPSDTPA